MARFQVQVHGAWAGELRGGWGPAVAGTYNQTGQSDEDASTFETREHAEAALAQLARYDAEEIARHDREPSEFCVVELDEELAEPNPEDDDADSRLRAEDLFSAADLDRTPQEW